MGPGGAIEFLYNVVEDSQANMNNVNILRPAKGAL